MMTGWHRQDARLLHGRYEVVRELGRGATSRVVLARDRLHGDWVAAKCIDGASEEVASAVRAELAAARSVVHPCLARLLDAHGLHAPLTEGITLCMQYERGESFARAAPRFQSWDALRPVVSHLLSALEALHGAGLVHGDLKPDNIILRRDGAPCLVDYGAATRIGRAREVSGTVRYMAPEVFREGKIAPHADLYSLGVMLLELGTEFPFPDDVRLSLRDFTSSDAGDRPRDAGRARARLGLNDATWTPAEPPILVGRSEEQGRIDRAAHAMLRGIDGPRVVIVKGASGMGKTRLLREAIAELRQMVRVVETGPTEPLAAGLARAMGVGSEPWRGQSWDEVMQLARGAPLVLAADDVQRYADADASVLEALLRSTPRDGRLLWLLAWDGDAPAGVSAETIELRPLDHEAIATWLDGRVDRSMVPLVAESTMGAPGKLRALALRTRRGTAGDLLWFDAARDDGITKATLSDEEGLALAVVFALGMRATDDVLERVSVPSSCLLRLEACGLLAREARHYVVCVSVAELLEVGTRLDNERVAPVLQALEGDAGDSISPAWPIERQAVRIAIRALTGDRQWLIAHGEEPFRDANAAPVLFMRAAEIVSALALRAPADCALLSLAQRFFRTLAEPTRAVKAAARLLRFTHGDGARARAWVLLSQALELAGRPVAALRCLRFAGDEGLKSSVRVLWGTCLQRVGRYAEAAEMLRAVPEESLEGEQERRARRESLLVAALYQGRLEEAERELRVLAEASDALPARQRARLLLHEGLIAFRRGRPSDACDAFERGLSVAEEHGLFDMLANACLNAGTAHHQLGNVSAALSRYLRGRDLAHAYQRHRTELVLGFNVEKLRVDVGPTRDGAAALCGLARRAEEAKHDEIARAAWGAAAEASIVLGDLAQARACLRNVTSRGADMVPAREQCELALVEAALAERSGDLSMALRAATRARELARQASASDVLARALLVETRLELERGETDRAGRAINEARGLVEATPKLLSVQLLSCSAHFYERSGLHALAARDFARSRETWESIVATVPAEWVDTLRSPLVYEPAHWLPGGAASERLGQRAQVDRVHRVLEIATELASVTELGRVCALAMDAMLELTSAERGFLLLRRANRLEVEIAQNLDRERVGKSHLKYSYGIAKRVVETGLAIVTHDARADERFRENASIHAMQLRSIVCVPVRAAGEVLGAVYVDNRFVAGQFQDADRLLVEALATHVGSALERSRLIAELRGALSSLAMAKEEADKLLLVRSQEVQRLSRALDPSERRAGNRFGMVGESQAMMRVFTTIERVAPSEVPVLLTGESGTGKERAARAIHAHGPRPSGPFVAVNCAALAESLLESELFGHTKGAFTGAVRDSPGLMLGARGGTLFLDEIAETSTSFQAKLLRVLQEREVRPVGSDRTLPIADVRIVSATNRVLADEIAQGRFREDLFYRLAVVEIALPPLRNRMEDVPLLASAILSRAADAQGRPAPTLTKGAMLRLLSMRFPGNVRELENVLQRALALCEEGKITEADLVAETIGATRVVRRGELDLEMRERVASLLRETNWNVSEVSRRLPMPRMTLYRHMRRWGLMGDETERRT